ncbi:MAG: PIG-L family deacetylase [Chloroflexi bacterium]|nr:PIG-L family deacetylase [Chloroflexota bacterium]
MGETTIYLSAHLDDAVYSCGARIYDQIQDGQSVQVVSCFTASPADEYLTAFTRELKERWGDIDDINAVRRAEDIAASRYLGFSYLHLPYTDCVYRQGGAPYQPLYPTVEHIFGDIHPAEANLASELLQVLKIHCPGWQQAEVYAPLAAGHHVDHLILRQAALAWRQEGARVRFYEDYPYADKPAVTQAALLTLPADCRSLECWTFGESALAAKVRAAACYRSQISTFWHNLDEMIEAFRLQAMTAARLAQREGYAENYWLLRKDCAT